MENEKKGIILMVFVVLLVAVNPIFAKLINQEGDFYSSIFIRAISASAVAFLYLIFTKTNLKVEKKNIPKLLIIVIFAVTLGDTIFIYALGNVSVINASILMKIEPIFVIILGYLIIGKSEILSKIQYLAMGIMIFSVVLVIAGNLQNLYSFNIWDIGYFFVLLAVFLWTCSNIVVKKYLTNINASLVVFYTYLIGSVVFIIYILFLQKTFVFSYYPVLMGVFHGTQVILFYHALKYIKLSFASAFGLTIPIISIILSFFIFHEIITILQIIGIIILFIGLYLLNVRIPHVFNMRKR
jgi:drug/metabolite transporter (DMT)-like permease